MFFFLLSNHCFNKEVKNKKMMVCLHLFEKYAKPQWHNSRVANFSFVIKLLRILQRKFEINWMFLSNYCFYRAVKMMVCLNLLEKYAKPLWNESLDILWNHYKMFLIKLWRVRDGADAWWYSLLLKGPRRHFS